MSDAGVRTSPGPADAVTTSTAASGAIDWVRRMLQRQVVRFVLVGGFNSAFSYGLFAALQLTLGRWIHYLVLVVASTIVSIVEAYVAQRWLVWRVSGRWWRELVRFSSVYGVALAVNLVLLPLLVEVVGLPVLVGQAIVMVANACGTFVIHRAFTFKRREPDPT